MAGNLQVQLQSQLVVTDLGLSPNPSIIARSQNVPVLNVTALYYEPYFQVPNGTATVNLPAATVYLVYVRNLSSSTNITLNYTPSGGSTTSVVLVSGTAAGAGSIFLLMGAAETSGGVTSVSLTATAITPAEVLVGA